MAGIIVGAKAPIVLSSRGSTAEEKYYSIALAALVAARRKGFREKQTPYNKSRLYFHKDCNLQVPKAVVAKEH